MHRVETETTSGSTSSSLIRRAQARDPAAWQRLARLYSPLVYHWVRKAGVPPQETADVVQDVFHAVVANLAGFRSESAGGGFHGWLWTITQHKTVDFFRRRASRPAAEGGTAAFDELQQLPSEADLSATSKATPFRRLPPGALEGVQAEFEPQTWEAFWRVTVEGHAPAEVAHALGLSVASVYQAKSRVLRRLRQELGDLFGDQG